MFHLRHLQRAPASHACLRAFYGTSTGSLKNVPSFVRGLFRGKIQDQMLFPYPQQMSADEVETVSMSLDPIKKYFTEVNDAVKNDATASVPDEQLEQLKALGMFGLQVPQDFGGLGLTNTGYARVVETAGRFDLGIGIILGAHQSIGFKGILLVGNEQQKEKYLPSLATGERIAAFCLTEPSSGSDASSIQSRAVLSDDGKHWVLNGSKIWISNGGIAEIFTVFAQTNVKDEKTGEMKDKVTAFIVERGFGGVTNGPPENKMGIKVSNTAEVFFENVKIPVENVLGEVGGGFKVAMQILNNGRFGMVAALSGTMKELLMRATAHATQRTQFGKKLKEYGTIQAKIASMATRIYASESMAYIISGVMDQGSNDYQLEAAIGKIFASEAAFFVADETIQILAGMGYMRAAEVERYARDVRIFRIFEGTNEILRLFVALTGLQSAGEDLKILQKALKSPLANSGLLLSEGLKRAKHQLFPSSVRPDGGFDSCHPELKKEAMMVEEFTAEIGLICEGLLIKYRKDIVEQQMLLNRVANVVIDLFAMTACLSRTTLSLSKAFHTAAHDVQLCKAFCDEARTRIRMNLAQLKSADTKLSDGRLVGIANAIFEQEGYHSHHPLGI